MIEATSNLSECGIMKFRVPTDCRSVGSARRFSWGSVSVLSVGRCCERRCTFGAGNVGIGKDRKSVLQKVSLGLPLWIRFERMVRQNFSSLECSIPQQWKHWEVVSSGWMWSLRRMWFVTPRKSDLYMKFAVDVLAPIHFSLTMEWFVTMGNWDSVCT